MIRLFERPAIGRRSRRTGEHAWVVRGTTAGAFFTAGAGGRAAREVKVGQEKVEQVGFMLAHEVSCYFYRRGK